MMQYGHKGPEARKSCRLFIGTSDCRSSFVVTRPLSGKKAASSTFGGNVDNCHQCGDHTALLSEGRTPPSVMPIDSPRESASGGNENSTGDSLVRRLEGLPWGRRRRPKRPLAHDSRILLALACLPFLPAAPTLSPAQTPRVSPPQTAPAAPTRHTTDDDSSLFSRRGNAAVGRLVRRGNQDGRPREDTREEERVSSDRGSFGCSVNLPLGSRSVDPHSTAVWCGNLLHSSPQSHTAELCCHSSFGGVLATTTKICSG